MLIDLTYYGLLKAWMNRKVKNCCMMMMMIVLSQQYIAKNMLTDFVFCTILVPYYEFMVAHCHCESKLVPWVSQACQGDEFVSRRSRMCVSAGPPCPLLTFVTSLTSAHSLLSTGQDPWCVNNADTFQDLVGHLGTLEPGIFISRQEKQKN